MAPQYAAASGGAGHRVDVRITGHRPAGQPSAWERDTEGIRTPAKACDFPGRGSRVLSGSKKSHHSLLTAASSKWLRTPWVVSN